MNEYDKQAEDFLKKTGTTFNVIAYKGRNPMHKDDKDMMDKWLVEFVRGDEEWDLDFYMGLGHNGAKPSAYDVLACIQKYEVDSFEEFCAEFGYNTYDNNYMGYNKRSWEIYRAVCDEYEEVQRMFGDALEELREIWQAQRGSESSLFSF